MLRRPPKRKSEANSTLKIDINNRYKISQCVNSWLWLHFLRQSFAAGPRARHHTHAVIRDHSWWWQWPALTGWLFLCQALHEPPHSYYLSHSGSQAASEVETLILNTQGHSHFCIQHFWDCREPMWCVCRVVRSPSRGPELNHVDVPAAKCVDRGTEVEGSLLLQVRSSRQKGSCQT